MRRGYSRSGAGGNAGQSGQVHAERRRAECGAAGRVARLVLACVIRIVNAIGIESSQADRHAHTQQIASAATAAGGLDASARAQMTHGVTHGRRRRRRTTVVVAVIIVVVVIATGTERR